MRFIVIAFTLKGQEGNWEKISALLDKVQAQEEPGDTILIHGFMPRHVLREKDFPETVVDKLDSLFVNQIHTFRPDNGQTNRLHMAELAYKTRATVYVIGDEIEGVADEVKLYEDRALHIVRFPLQEHGLHG